MDLFIILIIIIIIVLLINSGSKNQSSKREKHQQRMTPNWDSTNRKVSFSRNSENFWIPKNQTIKVNGYTITSGMIYAGKNLSTVTQDNFRIDFEPALIDPDKSINRNQLDYYNENDLGYWPSYQTISAEARAKYLEWLASDRDDPNTPIGYIFLYYYGLERRILHDSKSSERAKNELPDLISEVERLLIIYGSNNSFQRYASDLLEFSKFITNPDQFFKTAIENENLKFSEYYRSYYEYSLNFKIGLAYFSMNKESLPADWALKWGVSQYSLRTPAERCPSKFQELFKKKYEQKFDEGLSIKQNKTNIKVSYRPSSPSFGYDTFTAKTNIPDLTALNAPVNEIRKIIDECTDLLDPYSRYLGRNPNDKNSVDAISNLPKELLDETLNTGLKELINHIDSKLNETEFALLRTDHFSNHWDIKGVNKYRKKESIEIAQFLFKLGYGIEPDLRFGSAKFERDSQVVVFRLNPENFPKSPSKEYKLALPILHLTAMVGLADGKLTSEEEQHIDEYIEKIFQLTEKESLRLNAYLYWLKSENPGIKGLKNKIKKLDEEKRNSILHFLIKIADADGYISPGEVETLQKVAKIFEIDPETVYTAIHSKQTNDKDPILIVKGESNEGFSIPKEKGDSAELDKKIIDKTLQETDEVQSILTDIFSEEDEADEGLDELQNNEQSETILGLDKLHSNLVQHLFSKPNWTKVEYENICSEQGLFSDGALELINEKSFDEFDDVLLIETERIELNMEIVNELK